MTAASLGFDRPAANSLDAVSDRDFALEFLSAAAISAMHLSRFAEEIVIWCSAPYRFIRLSDAFTTGSSIMPQKRNPDAAELVRAKTGRINGALVGLLTVMKGLPLAYAKDMQEDKEPVFDAAEAWALSLAATTGMVRDMTPDAARMLEFAGSGFATATDLADWLVRVLKRPFRSAHHITGSLVALAEQKGVDAVRTDVGRHAQRGAWHHGRSVLGADGRGIRRVTHQLRRHRASKRGARGSAMAGGTGMRPAKRRGFAPGPHQGALPARFASRPKPSKGRGALQSVHWLFRGEGRPGPCAVTDGALPGTTKMNGSKGHCPWRGPGGNASGGARGNAPLLPSCFWPRRWPSPPAARLGRRSRWGRRIRLFGRTVIRHRIPSPDQEQPRPT